jgi:hypothetical protein
LRMKHRYCVKEIYANREVVYKNGGNIEHII